MVAGDALEEGITMPDYDDFDGPRQAADEESSLDVFEVDDTTSTDDDPERDRNAVRRPGRPQRDPNERPVDETVDTTEHTPEGLDLSKTELSGQDLSGRMTGAGLIGITPEGAQQPGTGRTEDPRGVEARRGKVGDGPPTRRKDPVERDEHGRQVDNKSSNPNHPGEGKTKPIDPDDVDKSDGSPFDLSGGPNAKFEAQSAGRKLPEYTQDNWKADQDRREKENFSERQKLGGAGTLKDYDQQQREKADTAAERYKKAVERAEENKDKSTVAPVKEALKAPEPETTPFDDPTMSTGTPQLANELIGARAAAELEADPEGDGRGPRGPRKVKDKPDVDASQTPADKFSAQINPVDPRQREDYGPGELTVSNVDLVTDPPQGAGGSQLADEGGSAVQGSSAPQESGDPLLDPNQWLGGGDAGVTGAGEPVGPTPTPPPAPEPVAAEPVAAAEVPAPQVGPSPAQGQPGDFAGPAPGADAPDLNAAAGDGDEPGHLDDPI